MTPRSHSHRQIRLLKVGRHTPAAEGKVNARAFPSQCGACRFLDRSAMMSGVLIVCSMAS